MGKVWNFVFGFAVMIAGAVAGSPNFDTVPKPLRSDKPDVVLRGDVDSADFQKNSATGFVPLGFDVPSDVVRIGVEYSIKANAGSAIDVGIRDAKGLRGWGGYSNYLVIGYADATAPFLPGPIEPGRWQIALWPAHQHAGTKAHYEIRIYFWRHGDKPAASNFSPVPLETGWRWYRGDFHTHTGNSDGTCFSLSGQTVPCPVFRTVEMAKSLGLDFLAITDHNTVSHLNAMRELQPYFDTILLIPGREITTTEGHANLFGTTEFVDFKVAPKNSMADIRAASEAAGGVFSANHPADITDENCGGCGWTTPSVSINSLHVMEMANGCDDSQRMGADGSMEQHFRVWEKALNEGARITGIAGSDNHDYTMGKMGIGCPATVVYAPELSERAILDAVLAGHVFVDYTASRRDILDVRASSGRQTAMMGDVLSAKAGSKIKLDVSTKLSGRAKLVAVLDGHAVPQWPDVVLEAGDGLQHFVWAADGKSHWIRFAVKDGDGKYNLVGNPIYLRP